ncbi:MAG: glycosyltransferase [Solirubrobacteraceae bacterium]
MRKLSVLIPTYNNADLLGDAIPPLLEDEATGEVVVVVDGSRDGSIEILEEMAARDPRVRPFWTENRGKQASRQHALDNARNDVVLLMDADVIAAPGLVSGHAAWHTDDVPRLVVGYMPCRVPPRRPGSFVIERYSDFYEESCRAFAQDPGEILRRLWGGNVSAPKAKIQEAGGHAGGIPVGYTEDVELGLRLAGTGISPVFDKRLRAEHRAHKSLNGLVKSAHDYGEALVNLERAYPGRIYHPNWPDTGSGAALRRFTCRPRGLALVRRLGGPLLTWAGRLRMWQLESRIGAGLELVEIQQGMIAASAAAPADGPARAPQADHALSTRR